MTRESGLNSDNDMNELQMEINMRNESTIGSCDGANSHSVLYQANYV